MSDVIHRLLRRLLMSIPTKRRSSWTRGKDPNRISNTWITVEASLVRSSDYGTRVKAHRRPARVHGIANSRMCWLLLRVVRVAGSAGIMWLVMVSCWRRSSSIHSSILLGWTAVLTPTGRLDILADRLFHLRWSCSIPWVMSNHWFN
jgi:hypothetical protein